MEAFMGTGEWDKEVKRVGTFPSGRQGVLGRSPPTADGFKFPL